MPKQKSLKIEIKIYKGGEHSGKLWIKVPQEIRKIYCKEQKYDDAQGMYFIRNEGGNENFYIPKEHIGNAMYSEEFKEGEIGTNGYKFGIHFYNNRTFPTIKICDEYNIKHNGWLWSDYIEKGMFVNIGTPLTEKQYKLIAVGIRKCFEKIIKDEFTMFEVDTSFNIRKYIKRGF